MRVLIPTSYYKPAYIYGGPTRSISALAEALAGLGVDVTVVSTNANGPSRLDVPLGKELFVDGVRVFYHPLANRTWGNFYYSPALQNSLREEIARCDIVASQSIWGHISLGIYEYCRCFNKPYTVSTRGQLLPWALKKSWVKKQLYLAAFGTKYLNKAAAIHCSSPLEEKAVAELGYKSPLFSVPNSVDMACYDQHQQSTIRQQLGISANAYVLLFLGRLIHQKRPSIAVDTLAALQDLSQPVHLIIAGPDEGSISNELEHQALKLGCRGQLHLIGLVQGEKVIDLLNAADLLLMPSMPSSESFGMSALEAIASGTPALVSDGVPVGQWIKVAVAGRVVPCTSQTFIQAAREMLMNPDQLREMGLAGSQLALRFFSNEAVARQMMSNFESILTAGTPSEESWSSPS